MNPTVIITRFVLALLCSFTLNANADTTTIASIIIDDVGNNYAQGRDVIQLPETLTIAILPDTTFAKTLAKLASKYEKEIMLHLPMQAIEHHRHSPGTLDLHMTHQEFKDTLKRNLEAVPNIRGVNNHMGSLLTRHPGHMSWLMEELASRGDLYFIDSKTTSKSIADKIASEYSIPSMTRDYFLDPEFKPEVIKHQFNQFIKRAKQRGYALAIAHPHPETIKFLKANLGQLKQNGIKLIPVSQLIQLTTNSSQPGDNTGEKNHVACTGTTCAGM